MSSKNNNIVIRRAVKEDMANVIDMIQELADFEKMSECPKLEEEDLIRDGGFGDDTSSNNFQNQRPLFICFIAENHKIINTIDDNVDVLSCSNNKNNDPSISDRPLTQTQTIGYAMCYYCYSTWQGKALFLEDLYVRPLYRKLGVGRKIFEHLKKFAKGDGCSRLDFHVLDWNPARMFYDHLGALDLTSSEGWHMYRVNL